MNCEQEVPVSLSWRLDLLCPFLLRAYDHHRAGAWWTTESETLPISARLTPPRPCSPSL